MVYLHAGHESVVTEEHSHLGVQLRPGLLGPTRHQQTHAMSQQLLDSVVLTGNVVQAKANCWERASTNCL